MRKDFLTIGRANAKLNLHLQVLNRRSDNYHNIFSVMAELEIHDLLKLEAFEVSGGSGAVKIDIVSSGGAFSSLVDGLPADENLISIAVKKYLANIGCGGYMRFALEKNIPSGAGLGGGSSDAASALNLVCGALKRKPDSELYAAAEAAGSDVPFFISGGIAFAEGRGEILQKIECRVRHTVILVNNGIHVNTGAAYSALKRGLANPSPDFDAERRKREIRAVIPEISEWKNSFINDFEDAVFGMHPELAGLKRSLYRLGADFSLMSGSGSTIYGIFKEENMAEKAASELEKEGNRVFITRICA